MLSKICCFNTDFCKFQCCGLTRNKNVKIGYIIILILAYLVLQITNTIMTPVSLDIALSYSCQDSGNIEQCVRDKNAEIIFASVGFMHLVILCCMFGKSEKVKIINEGLWLIKVLIITLVALLLSLLKKTTFFEYLGYFTIWGANLLYLFSAIVFIDLIYALDMFLDQCAQQNNKIYIFKAILSITILISASFICFLSFNHNPIYVCWTNVGCLVIFFILTILRVFQGNSILVSSLVGLCINIIGFYIQNEEIHGEQQFNTFLVIFKGLFVLFTLFGMLCQGSNKLRTKKSTLNELLALNTTPSEEDNRYVSSNKWTVYHYIMMVIATTLPAALCWQSNESRGQVEDWMQINNLTWWIAVIAMYVWSLVCSRLFPEKDFSDLENYFREYELQ